MTDITPPPHLLKQFSEQARVDSSKRGGSGYLKTFARFCIEWAVGQLNSKPTPNPSQIRSSDITPPPELVQQWWEQADQYQDDPKTYFDYVATEAAQWGADQELEACCEWVSAIDGKYGPRLRLARRPKPPSLKKQSLALIDLIQGNREAWDISELNVVRRALEQLDD